MFRPTWTSAEHARVIAQRFRRMLSDLPELRVPRIDQPVILMHGQPRGDKQQTTFRFLHEVIANLSEPRRRGSCSPAGRQVRGFQSLTGYVIGNVRCGQHQVVRRVLRIQMHKIFQHGERLMFGRVGHTRSRA
jgi:hypothetical protein